MPRVNKKTRIKGLPPRIQLRELDAQTKTRLLLGIDKRFHDDVTVLEFTSSSNIMFPSMLPNSFQSQVEPDLTTSLEAPGRVVAGVSDTFLGPSHGTQSTGLFEPFRDVFQPAVDGLSSGDSFYTGLASKDKIEIDISANPCSFKFAISQSLSTDSNNGTYTESHSYPMAYYNFENKVWEGIGVGWPLQTRNPAATFGHLESARDFGMFGFSPSIITLPYSSIIQTVTSSNVQTAATASQMLSRDYPWGQYQQQHLAGHITNRYGFPYAAKFHATGSQVLDMSTKIDKPFLLEKLVVEISGAQFTMFDSVQSATSSYHLTSSILPACVNNFFILNQRTGITINVSNSLDAYLGNSLPNYSLPANQQLTPSTSTTNVNTIREVITYGGVTTHTSDINDDPFNLICLSKEKTDLFTLGTLALEEQTWRGFSSTFGPGPSTYLSSSFTASLYPLQNMTRDSLVSLPTSITASVSGLSWTTSKLIKLELQPVVPHVQNFAIPGPQHYGNEDALDLTGFYEKGGRTGLGIELVSTRGGTASGLSYPKYHFISGSSDTVSVVGSARAPNDFVSNTFLSGSCPVFTDIAKPGTFYASIPAPLELPLSSRPLARSIPYVTNKPYLQEPYLLLPTDKLIFGWQLPCVDFTAAVGTTQFDNWVQMSIPADPVHNKIVDICQMSFDGPAKITMYGSYLQADTALTTPGVNDIRIDGESQNVTTRIIE